MLEPEQAVIKTVSSEIFTSLKWELENLLLRSMYDLIIIQEFRFNQLSSV